jgi:hypothetical protein
MSVTLRCVDKQRKGEVWTLELEDHKAVIRRPTGDVAGAFSPADAVERFQMPSFSESIKYFGVRLGDELHRFDVAKSDLKQIKLFINRTIAAAGPEAVQAVRNKAIRDALIGAACIVAGIVLSLGSFLAVADKPEGGTYYVAYGLPLFGLIMVGKGIYGFMQHGQLKQLTEISNSGQ